MESDNIRILAVDDNADNLISIKALIRESFPGAEILTAASGRKGLELAVSEDPDVILLDIIMPGMDGFEVCRRLKADRMLRDTPVVFVTAVKEDRQNRIRALECGAEAFLSKPIDETDLTAVISAMAKIKAANTQKRDERRQLESLVSERTRALEQEIEVRKKSEEALRQSEERLVVFLNSSRDFIYLKDENYRHIIANNQLAGLFGRPVSEIIGKTDFELLPFDIASKWRTTDAEARTGIRLTAFDFLGGKTFEMRKFPVNLPEGQVGVGAFIKDVTVEMERQAKLRNISERNRIITECMIKTFGDKRERLNYALREALKMTGSRYGCVYTWEEGTAGDSPPVVLTYVSSDADGGASETVFYRKEYAGIWEAAVGQGKPVIVNTESADAGQGPQSCYMSIPILRHDGIAAVAGFAGKPSGYSDDDINEMTLLMNGVWLAAEKMESQKRTEALLEQTQAMFNNHEAIMLLVEPGTWQICDSNPAAADFYGYSAEELREMNIRDLNAEGAGDGVFGENQTNHTFLHKLKSGEVRNVDVYSSLINSGGRDLFFFIIFDVTRREKAYQEISFLGYHDYLTGLYNRRFFEQSLREMDTQENLPLCIILADINGLKTTNEIYGHEAGDKILVQSASLLRASCRENGVIARIGGDEFAVIIPNFREEEALKLLETIRANCGRYYDNNEKEMPVSLSFGYQCKFFTDQKVSDTLRAAEKYLFQHKIYESSNLRNLSIDLVMNALFAKSKREMEHSSRVSGIAEKLALWMGFPESEITEIRIAALLHDIGKIGIPESILNKQGRLTDEERKVIEQHPEIGWRILGSSAEYKDLANYVFHHHERWDGRGYPSGLYREEIPIQSRIIAVADTYDAMTKTRPYRKALTSLQAVGELKRCAGAQFDPRIISVFMQNILGAAECM